MNFFKWQYKYSKPTEGYSKPDQKNITSLALTYGTETVVELFFDVPELSIKVVDHFTPATYTARIKDICGYDAAAIKVIFSNAELNFNEKTANLFCGLPSITQTRKAVVNSIYHNFYEHEVIRNICKGYIEAYLTNKATFSDQDGETNLTGTKFDKADDVTRERYAHHIVNSCVRNWYGLSPLPQIKNPTEVVAHSMLAVNWRALLADEFKSPSKTTITVPINDWSNEFKTDFLRASHGVGLLFLDQTLELQKEAIDSSDNIKSLWKIIKNPSEELILFAAEEYPAAIKDLPNITEEQILALFQKNRDIVQYVKDPSLRLQKKFVNFWRRYKKGVDATYKYDDKYHPHDPEDFGNHHATLGADITKTYKVWNGVHIGNMKNPSKTLVRAICRLGSLIDVKQHMDMIRESDILAGLRCYNPYYTLEALDHPKEKFRVINEKYIMYAIKHMDADKIPVFASWIIHRYAIVPEKVLKALAKKNCMSLGYMIHGKPRLYADFVKSYDVTKANKLSDTQILETIKNSMRPDATGFQYVPNPSKALVLAVCEYTGGHIQYLDKVDDAYQLEIIDALQGGGIDMSKSSYLPSATNWLYKMPEYIKDITPEAKALVEKYEAENKASAEAREKAEREAYQARQKAEQEQRKLEHAEQQRLATIEDGDMV